MGFFEKWRGKRKSAGDAQRSAAPSASAAGETPPVKAAITEALRRIQAPGLMTDVIALGLVTGVRVQGGDATITLSLSNPDEEIRRKLGETIKAAVAEVPGVDSVGIILMNPPPRERASGPAGGHRPIATSAAAAPGAAPGKAVPEQGPNPFESQAPIPGIERIVAVGSGKGGVGKSSVALNLALALRAQGRRVGLLDADIYGPSLAIMAGHRRKPVASAESKLEPVEKLGLKMMSMGFLIDPGEAVVWRGPMLMGALRQFLLDVSWGELDYLVVDLPPGTGDVQLSLAQITQVWGALLVTTPQEVACADMRRCAGMFAKVEIALVGVVENMSGFVCDACDEATPIFGAGGGAREARALGVPLLGQIPLDPAISAQGDAGEPIVAAAPEAPASRAFAALAEALHEARPVRPGQSRPAVAGPA